MKKNQVVTIYENPLTRTKAEGQAKLLRLLADDDGNLQRWEVRFLGKESREPKVERFILKGAENEIRTA